MRVSTLAAVLVVLAGCGIGAAWPNLPPPDSVHHNVLIVGDSLMGSTQTVLPSVLAEATIFDEHRNGSGLVTPIDGKTPVDFVKAMLDAHPTTDTVLAEWTGACANPCPYSYGSQQFFDAWNKSRQSIVDAVRSRANPPTLVWVISPPAPPDPVGGQYGYTEGVSNALSWQTRARAPTANVPLADWWTPLMAQDDFLGHYDQFLAYQVWPEPQAAPHRVRGDDTVHLTVDGAFRTSVWTATELRQVWQQRPATTTTTTRPPTTDPPPVAGSAPGGAHADSVLVSTPRGTQAIDFPDPFVFRAIGSTTWFAYATGAGFVDLQMITSPDLVNWSWVGDPLPGGTNGWADLFSFSWAPSVIERPGNSSGQHFVMYYTAHDRTSGRQCIGRATSSSAAGPFSDERTTPLICQSGLGGSIDPSPYVAADGSLWLVFSNVNSTTSIWSVRLTSDGLSTTTSAYTRLLSTAPGTWEGPLIEGPTMISSPSSIELFYSANVFDTSSYAVGVARCDTPAGPCTRIYTTPVLATRFPMAGPGGETPFRDASGNWRVAFHSWTTPLIGYPAGKRTLRLLPMTFTGDLPKIG